MFCVIVILLNKNDHGTNDFTKHCAERSCRAKMVLSSVETAVLFYENYGFRWTRESLDKHPALMQYETYDPSKEYFILEYYLE